MALTKAFYDAVKEKSVRDIRIMMTDSLLVDLTFNEFEEMKKVAANVDGLYDVHDGKVFEKNQSLWNDDYMNKQMVELIWNFSEERIEHTKKVVRYLRGSSNNTSRNKDDIKEKKVEPNRKMSYEEQKHYDQVNDRYRGAKIATGAVVGVVAGGAIASAMGVTVIGGVAVGAVVGSAVATVLTNGGN